MDLVKRRELSNARVIVVKIGSAVLADERQLDRHAMEELAGQLARVRAQVDGRKLVVVSSGAVAAGRAIMADKIAPADGRGQEARQALAAIGQASLMRAWNEAFGPHGIVTAQALLTRDDFRIRERFQHAANTFSKMLVWNVLPIVNENDTVSVRELKFGDNDTLASLVVNLVRADLFVNMTSAPGVLAENPRENPDAKVMRSIEDIGNLDLNRLCGGKTALGTGGMYSKLLAARRVAQLGTPTLILPGREKNALSDAFSGKEIGTWVYPAQKSISRRKFWIAYQSEPAGEVEVDEGAAAALIDRGRSLLPGGITGVSGDFQKGDLLRISRAGSVIGVGFSNYSSDEINRIRGLKRHEIAAILGDAHYPDVIHRDNMLLDAAY